MKGDRGRFWRGPDTEWGIGKNYLRSNNEEFDVGCRLRDKDWFQVAVGFIVRVHKSDEWVSEKGIGVMMWCNMKCISRRFGEYGCGYFEYGGVFGGACCGD